MVSRTQDYIENVAFVYDGDECLRWPFRRDNHGYARGTYSGKRSVLVTRIVCEHENGPPPTPKHEAAHSCGKGHLGCVNRKHLSWKTHRENQADRLVHGTHIRGERHHSSKLTSSQVLQIRALKGKLLSREIAAQYGISSSSVREILTNTTWSWLDKADTDSSSPSVSAPLSMVLS